MRLSNVVLSFTALLSQVASGFYLLKVNDTNFASYGFAKINFEPDAAVGGLATSTYANPYATINLDADGDIGNGWLLRPVQDGVWRLLSRASASIRVRLLSFPFFPST